MPSPFSGESAWANRRLLSFGSTVLPRSCATRKRTPPPHNSPTHFSTTPLVTYRHPRAFVVGFVLHFRDEELQRRTPHLPRRPRAQPVVDPNHHVSAPRALLISNPLNEHHAAKNTPHSPSSSRRAQHPATPKITPFERAPSRRLRGPQESPLSLNCRARLTATPHFCPYLPRPVDAACLPEYVGSLRPGYALACR